MTQEDKELLLKDLCARLPYGVIMTNIELRETHYPLTCEDLHNAMFDDGWDDVPYLRPMSSMPEEEFEYLTKLGVENSLKCIEIDDPKESFSLATKFCVEQLGYLYEHHYDVNGLIPSGLAIEVTEDNNPYKED